MKFLTLILSLPTENATLRMRAWRALKAAGAPALRDGVYLLPELGSCRATLEAVEADVNAGGGSAFLLPVEADTGRFEPLFDRREDYAALAGDVAAALAGLSVETAPDALKVARKLRKAFTSLGDIDYFPGEARAQAYRLLSDLEQKIAHALSPDEPNFVDKVIPSLEIVDYQSRTWATRKRPWVDRLASAWLIQRFIDKHADFRWLETPTDCPPEALGFDFDGAAFTHVGGLVTFEVLVESFGIQIDAINRIAALVHFLDVGGLQPSEASGVESVLKGMREAISDDDDLLKAASSVFDGLFAAFTTGASHG